MRDELFGKRDGMSRLAKARKAAEKCLEFWLQRGILDKGIHANEAK